MKTLIQGIKVNSVEEAEEILKAAGTEELFEKAHTDGEMHPNGIWVWRSSASNGKGDWRVANPKKGRGSTSKKNELGDDVISRESSNNLLTHLHKMGKEAKGILYHYDGTRVSRESIKNRIFDSKVNSASILDVVGTKGEDKIDRSAMKDDKIAGSYMVKYKEKEGMYDLYKFKVSGKTVDEKTKNSEPKNDLVDKLFKKESVVSVFKNSKGEVATIQKKTVKEYDKTRKVATGAYNKVTRTYYDFRYHISKEPNSGTALKFNNKSFANLEKILENQGYKKISR